MAKTVSTSLGLDYQFQNPSLLTQALTHPSFIHGRRDGVTPHYERLEFLGDRVLGLVVAEMLLERFPKEAEGALARRHAWLVQRETLVRVAQAIGLSAHLRLSKGEEDAGGRDNATILADACEALIGAIFADGGFPAARTFVRLRWGGMVEENLSPPKDAKTSLQEWLQARGRPLPVYRIEAADGPAHEPVFVVSVSAEGLETVSARGSSKRAAEQAAASAMLETLRS